MFRYSSFIDSLIKAMTHKYIRRIPKGVTKTGATKYMYYYAGQEGHGKGIAHDEELTAGASFAFGEHGKTRYHAHIVLEAGDRITIQYDDGDKKGQKETMSKKEFRDLLHKEHASAIQGAKEKAAKQLKDFKAGKEKGVKVKQSTLNKLEERVKNLDALAPTAKEDEQSPFTQFAMSTPTNYGDINKINEALSKTATTLDTREKTINFLTAYKEHVPDILRTLDKVVTTQDLNKEFGKLTTMLQDRSDLLLRMAKNDYQRIRVNIPLITRENLEISGVRKDLEDRIDYDIFLINKMSEDVSPQYMEEVQFFYEGVLRRKEMEDARKEKPFVVSSVMQSFIDHPFLTSSSSEQIYQIPSVIYRQQADSVIDFYLSHNMGKKFAKIPNIREVLKDQIERRVDEESIINMNNIDDIRANIRALPSGNKSITFENMPVLQSADSLNRLFDAPTLDKLRNKLEGGNESTIQDTSNPQFKNLPAPKEATPATRKKQVSTLIQSITSNDTTEMTSDKLTNTLSAISKQMKTKADVLDTLKQIKMNIPNLVTAYKQAYPNKDDISSAFIKEPFSYVDGYWIRKKEDLRKELITAQILRRVIFDTEWAETSNFDSVIQEDIQSWKFESNYAQNHTLEQSIDNLINHVQKHKG